MRANIYGVITASKVGNHSEYMNYMGMIINVLETHIFESKHYIYIE